MRCNLAQQQCGVGDASYGPTKNSKTAAHPIACLIVKLLLDTDVAKALATSFAPIMNASRVQKMTPKAKR